MKIMIWSTLILISLTMLILFLSLTIMKKFTTNMEKSSPYECGFQPTSKQRINFNMRFFQITIIFLVFDAEICLLLPTPNSIQSNISSFILMSFLTLILIGTLFEWKMGSLSWLN